MFVADRMQEWCIWYDGSLWRIYAYRGGQLPDELRGGWMSLSDCQQKLIGYLESKNKFGKAIYPGSRYVRKFDGSRTD